MQGRRLVGVILMMVGLDCATAGVAKDNYSAPLARLSGVHPHDLILPAQVKPFRVAFVKKYPHLARRIGGLAKEFDAPLMPEPPATGSKHEFVETMDRIRRFCGRMQRFAQAYLATGDRRYGEQAKRILLHIARWGPNAGGGFRACDEVPMSIMQLCPRVYDWTYDLLSDAERKLVRESMRVRGKRMYRRVGGGRTLPTESHGGRMLGFMIEAGVVFYGEFPEARQWLDGMVRVITKHYPRWGGDDGGWAEGPSYWAWYMSYIIPALTSLETATGSDALRAKLFFRNTPYYGIYCAPATLRHRPFGDGADYLLTRKGHGANLTMCRNARFFGRVFKNGHFVWQGRQIRTTRTFYEALVESAGRWPDVQPTPPGDLPQARHFRDIGWVAMHASLAAPEDDVFLLFKSSPYGGASHSHADQNAFALFAYGEPLAIASGYYDYYGSPHHYGWTRQTKANNAILVDGAGQLERGGSGRIEAFVTDGTGEGMTYARGDARGGYSGRLTRAVRHVVKLDAGAYVLVDELQAPKPAAYSWLLHALGKMQISAADKTATLTIRRGLARCDARVMCSLPVAATQTGKFTPPPLRAATIKTRSKPNRPDQWHATVATKRKSRACVFFSRLAVSRKGERRRAFTDESFAEKPTHIGVSWRRGKEREVVVVDKSGGQSARRHDGLALSGRLGFVRCDSSGDPSRWLLVGGKSLTLDGRALVTASSPATISVAVLEKGAVAVGLGSGRKGATITVALPADAPAGPARWRRSRSDRWTELRTVRKDRQLQLKHPGTPGELVLGLGEAK